MTYSPVNRSIIRELNLARTVLLLLLTISAFLFPLWSCSLKPSIKNTADLELGDTKEVALERWGKPDRINSSVGPWGERQQWVYDCIRFVDCDDDPRCFFKSPCFYLYFENNRLIDIYDSR